MKKLEKNRKLNDEKFAMYGRCIAEAVDKAETMIGIRAELSNNTSEEAAGIMRLLDCMDDCAEEMEKLEKLYKINKTCLENCGELAYKEYKKLCTKM